MMLPDHHQGVFKIHSEDLDQTRRLKKKKEGSNPYFYSTLGSFLPLQLDGSVFLSIAVVVIVTDNSLVLTLGASMLFQIRR